VKAGLLRHRVRVERKVIGAQDPATGDVLESWESVYADIPADISPLSAREFLAAQTLQSQVTARVTLRSLPGIDASCRFVGLQAPYAGRIFNIAGLLEDKHSGLQHQTFPVFEGVNEG